MFLYDKACLNNRLALLNNHFNDIPFTNCYKFYKICLILAHCKNVDIFDQGNFIYFEGNTFVLFDLVMYIYYRSISKNVQLNMTYEIISNKLHLLKHIS